MSRLNPNAGAFVPSFSMPAVAAPATAPTSTAATVSASAPAAAAAATPPTAAAKSPVKPTAKPTPIATAPDSASAAKAASTPSGKSTPSAKAATAAKAKVPLSEDDAITEDVEMDGAASDRLVYSIDYLLQFQPICDTVPCYFPDVVRAPAPQRLGRYLNNRLVYTVPELLHFQPLYQMFPPDLEWNDTLAIVVESVDKKVTAPAKLSKKEKAKAKAAAAAAAAATTGTAADQLQYDPTLMCYFNPTEYAAALNMAVYGSTTTAVATSATDKVASALSTNGSAVAESLNPVEEAVVGKQQLTKLLDEMQPETVPNVLKSFEEIAITCTHTLQEVIGQLFDRAIAEPTLCDAFAQLCSGMAERTPEFKEGAKTINFRRILLTRCYEALIEEPETSNLVIQTPSTATAGTSKSAANGTTTTGNGSSTTAPQHSWRRQCMLRNVCFIGELFRRQLLTENIMHVCVAMMLEDEVNPQMDVIDAACRLLMLVGDLLDGSSPASRRTMDEYFDVLQRLAEHSTADQALKDTIAEMTSVRAGGWAKKRLEATVGVGSPAKPGGAAVPLTPLASTVAAAIGEGATSATVATPVRTSSEATASDAGSTSVSAASS